MSIACYNQLWSILVYLWLSEIQKGLGISARLFACGFRRPTKQSYLYSRNRLSYNHENGCLTICHLDLDQENQ